MDFRTLLAMEASLIHRLRKDWRKHSAPTLTAIEKAVADKNWHKATDLVQDIDMSEIGEANRDYIRYMMMSFATFGAMSANNRGPDFVKKKMYPLYVDKARDQVLQYLEHQATTQLQAKMLQLIAEAENEDKDEQLLIKKTGVHTLYVCRKLKNASEFTSWMKEQGFETTLLDNDVHVTVCFSKEPLEWGSVPPKIDGMLVTDGKRVVKPLGDKGAVVMHFECDLLQTRWQEFRDAGASWDFDGYRPHLTISYNTPEGLDLSKVKPYEGVLEFGPEVYEPVDTDKDIAEKDDIGLSDLSVAGRLQAQLGMRKKKKVKKADRYLDEFVSFGEDGDAMLQLISSLQSSRLSTWGFMAEAEHVGATQYRLTAVLDGRTSRFCRMIDGRVFDVAPGSDLINSALSADNPEDLKSIQPWPDQSEEAVAEYEGMTNEELTSLGLNVPPFHPGCRTRCTMLEGGDLAQGTGAPDVEDPTVPRGDSGYDDFSALGVKKPTEEQLQYWNDFVNTLPNAALASMLGMTEKELLAAEIAADAITISSTGELSFTGKVALGGAIVDVNSILDPLTGRVFLDQATFSAGDPAAAAAFMERLFTGMMDQAESVGMTALVVESGAAAYQYAQMGFLMRMDDWQTHRLQLVDDLQGGSLSGVYNALNDDEQAMVLNLLSSPHEGALGVLVDLPIVINGEQLGAILLREFSGSMSLDLADSEAVNRARQYL